MRGEWSSDGNSFAISTKENIINLYDRRNTGVVQSIKFQTEIDSFAWDNTASVFLVAVWEYLTLNLGTQSEALKSARQRIVTLSYRQSPAIQGR